MDTRHTSWSVPRPQPLSEPSSTEEAASAARKWALIRSKSFKQSSAASKWDDDLDESQSTETIQNADEQGKGGRPPGKDASAANDNEIDDGLSDESGDEGFDDEIREALADTALAQDSEAESRGEWWLESLRSGLLRTLLVAAVVGILFAAEQGCKAQNNGQSCVVETSYPTVTTRNATNPAAPGTTSTVAVQLYFTSFVYWIALTLAGHLAGSIAVFSVLNSLRALPIMGKAATYFLHRLDGPLAFLLMGVVMLLTFNNSLFPFTFYRYMQAGPTADNSNFVAVFPKLCWSVLVTGLGFVGKCIIMRLVAISFHRAAYLKRIRQSLMAEKVLIDLQKQRRLDASGGLAQLTREKGGAFNPKFLFESLSFKDRELLRESAVSILTLASWIEYLKRSEMMIYIQASPPPVAAVGEPATRRRNALVADMAASPTKFTVTPMTLNNAATAAKGAEGGVYSRKRSMTMQSRLTKMQLLAHRIFSALQGDPGQEEILPEDLEKFLKRDFVEPAFALFDRDVSGTVTERELYCSLLGVVRERLMLKGALMDAEVSLKKLDSAVTGFAVFLLGIAVIMIYRGEVLSVLTSVSTVLVALTFAFGSSVKSVFEALLFIFASHPFDVGDRIAVDDTIYTVSRIGLLQSQLKRTDNGLVYYSNSVLALKPIQNLRRSPEMVDFVSLQLDAFTPSGKLRELEAKLGHYLRRHALHFKPNFEAEYQEIENLNKLLVRFWIGHRGNFANRKRYRERRSRLILKLRRLCEVLGINYSLPPQEVIAESEHTKLMGMAAAGRDMLGSQAASKITNSTNNNSGSGGTAAAAAARRAQEDAQIVTILANQAIAK